MRRPSEPLLFFFSAVSYSISWTAVSSELGRLSAEFGPRILLQCNLAYFLPSLLVNGSQLFVDEYLDTRFGWFKSNCWRDVTGFGGCALLTAAYPFLPSSTVSLLAFVAGLGCCSSVAFGASYEVAAHRPPGDSVALSLGFVSSGPLVLLAEASLRMGPKASWGQICALYQFVALVCACGLGAALWAHWRIWKQQEGQQASQQEGQPKVKSDAFMEGLGSLEEALLPAAPPPCTQQGQLSSSILAAAGSFSVPPSPRRHSSVLSRGCSAELTVHTVHCPVLPSTAGADEAAEKTKCMEAGGLVEVQDEEQGSYGLVLRKAWPAAAALAIGIGTSMLLFPLFPYVKSDGWLGPMLPQAMFWVRVFCDILGRIIPHYMLSTAPATLLLLALLKLALTPLLFPFIHQRLPVLPSLGGDAAVLLFVAVQWVLSGYLGSCCQIAAPRLVPAQAQSKAASAMALVFQCACLAGLLAAIPAQKWAA